LPLIQSVNGRIINIGSISGRVTQPLCGVYTAFIIYEAATVARLSIRYLIGKNAYLLAAL